MIYCYTGTPGSGKSYHATEKIDQCLRRGINVVANYPIKVNYKHRGKFVFLRTSDFSVDFFTDFARENHVPRKESQTLIVIDEAHILFNSRGFVVKERMKWLEFLSWSRHVGYDVLLITQNDRSIDRQVRGLIEYNYKHRKLTSFGFKGWLLVAIVRKKFVSIRYWYAIDEKVDDYYFNIKKKVADLYDTYEMFVEQDSDKKKEQDSDKKKIDYPLNWCKSKFIS